MHAAGPLALVTALTLPASAALASEPAPDGPAWTRVRSDLIALSAVAPDVRPIVLERALTAAYAARRRGFGTRRPFLTVIDYGKPTSERRLWVFDLATKRLVFREHVAHGKGTGGETAERVSNRGGSLASSVGLFVTREVFRGSRGRSLRLVGLEPGFNDQAFKRAIIVHGAPYMSRAYLREHGRFGQSHGCPALDPEVTDAVIETLAGGSLLFIHMDDPSWLAGSAWLRGEAPRRLRARAYRGARAAGPDAQAKRPGPAPRAPSGGGG